MNSASHRLVKQLTFFILLTAGLFCLNMPLSALADETALADVVVIVDTSTSMKDAGMDPERSSLLVTKLLADIVPGELAVVRLLDIVGDQDVIHSQSTGKTGECPEDPSQTCGIVDRTSDWNADARSKILGAKIRPNRADENFKKELESHLKQHIHNSMFDLAFQAALGIFDQHKNQSNPRTVVWLSDGRSDDELSVKSSISEVKATGANIEAIVFGAGDTRLPQEAQLDVLKVSTPAEIMKAFANTFRRIVEAPYRVDHIVSEMPSFEMKRNIQEAWIVVYGDQTLGDVEIDGPNGKVKADYAADSWPSAGAYRVAYLKRPEAGNWVVLAKGGGTGTAYAVIQRSDLVPELLEPKNSPQDIETLLVVGIKNGLNAELFTDVQMLQDAVITAEIQGQTIRLVDDGTQGDLQANDGRFSAKFTFTQAGQVPVKLHLQSSIADRITTASVTVEQGFHYKGSPLSVDLGSLGVAGEACRSLIFSAEQQGTLAFELSSLRQLPMGHTLEIRLPNGSLYPDKNAIPITLHEPMRVCLKTDARVVSSQAQGEPWLMLHVSGSQLAEHQIPIHLSWRVDGLSFWELWHWLILSILFIILIIIILLGFILPQRFRATLAVTFVPDREDLDEQSPQPIKQWKGVGIGFYRNARAYLQGDFRLTGKSHGALAVLLAEKDGNRVMPGNGISLYRETIEGEWELISPQGGKIRTGDVYRIGFAGPYFRISVRG